MRVTNRTMTNNLLLNLNRGMGRLERINQQLSSKKQINLPSDDPVKAGIILRMHSSVRETDQYLRNVDSAASCWTPRISYLRMSSPLFTEPKSSPIGGFHPFR